MGVIRPIPSPVTALARYRWVREEASRVTSQPRIRGTQERITARRLPHLEIRNFLIILNIQTFISYIRGFLVETAVMTNFQQILCFNLTEFNPYFLLSNFP